MVNNHSQRRRQMLGKFVAVTFLILFAFSLGVSFGSEPSVSNEDSAPADLKQAFNKEDFNLATFWETIGILKARFIDRDNIKADSLIDGAIQGAVRSLGDPYTEYLPPEESKQFIDNIRGSFEGIGTEIGFRNRLLTIIAPLEGTPAQRAGLKAGDIVLQIDGASTLEMTLEEAVGRIRGPKGTAVVLTVQREGEEEAMDISIVRDTIAIPVLEWRLLEEAPDIAYIRIFQFTESASQLFQKAAQEILGSPARAIVLDLRNNPGGFLEVSVDIAGWFLDKQSLVAREEFSDGTEKLYNTSGNASLKDYPVAVLINQGSASASEILAGALRDDRGIKLIGEKTFGKGSVQELESLTNGGSLKVTVARWLTPDGLSIQKEGLVPDIKIKAENDEGDVQLEKALEALDSEL